MIRRTSLVLPVLLASALLAACGGSDPEAPQASAPPASSASSAPSPAASAPASPSSSPTESGTLIELTVAGGQVSGDTGRVEVPLGTTVVLRVTSDAADEVHVHGVDKTLELAPGSTAETTFVADVPGVFEIELHEAGTVLTRMQVQ